MKTNFELVNILIIDDDPMGSMLIKKEALQESVSTCSIPKV